MEKILDRIRKLMALAESNNPHEAANAMRKVQAIMREHQLSETDVQLRNISETSAESPNKSRKQPNWSGLLSALICKSFGVHAVFSSNHSGCRCNFIGDVNRVEIAAYCYAVLARQIVKARQEYISSLSSRTLKQNKTAKADLFCEGWISGVYKQVIALVPNEKETALIQTFINQKYSEISEGKFRDVKRGAKTKHRDAMVDGFRSGSSVKLHAAVAGQEQQKIEFVSEENEVSS